MYVAFHGESMRALNGIRVLDLSRVLAGPYCTMVLGDLGAEVVKVEPPDGDDTRAWGPPFAAGESAYYLCVNRNKKSITVNLKTAEGRGLLTDLANQSDILVENFRPGTLSRFSLDYESVSATNPRLIYCSISGFGQSGSLRDKPGYDFMIQAMGGIMSITGEPEGEPMKTGVAVADLFAGQNAVIAILAALQAREKTGKGQYIDISLFDSQIGWLANVASNYLVSGKLPKRYGNAHANIVPYQSFAASDGWFVITIGNEKHFESLCSIIQHPELIIDPRFATNSARVQNREALIGILTPIFKARTVKEWISLIGDDFPCGPINDLQQVFEMSQVREREMLIEMDHPTIGKLPLVGSPLKMSDTPVEYRLPPPLLGEHTKDVLKDVLGYDDARVQQLKNSGAV
jgi:formyl-CoA transferase